MHEAALNEANIRADQIDPASREARKRSLPVTEGLAQARRYAALKPLPLLKSRCGDLTLIENEEVITEVEA